MSSFGENLRESQVFNFSGAITMVVDDSAFSMELTCEALRGFGVQVRYSCQSAADAIDILKDHTVDLLLVDTEMPGMDGHDLVRWVRNSGLEPNAFVETIADLAGAGITDIDALTPGQIQTVFELYATHAIEARICNDIGTKVVTLPANSRAAERVQAQLRDFIQRGVSDAINSAGVNIQSLTPDAVMGFVTDVYQSAFDVLQTMGDGEAAK